jgi:hypothetical protein
MDLATVKDGDDADEEIDLTYTHTGLVGGTTLLYRVRAHNKEGFSPWSREDAGTTAAQIVPMGFAADVLSAEAMGTSAIMLEWEEPEEIAGSPITGYSIEYAADDDGEPGNWMVLVEDTESTDTMSTDMMNLSAGMTRHYRVYAVNANVPGAHKRGPVSNMAMATTAGSVIAIEAPTRLTATPGSAPGTVELSWTPGAGGTNQALAYIAEDGSGLVFKEDLSSAANSYTATGLDNSKRYGFTVGTIPASGSYMWHSITIASPN